VGDDLDTVTYEQLVEALEAIITRMAAGDIGIEEVADLYEQAGRLHAQAAARLEGVRRRIEGLVEEDGELPGVG
jgi:exodeoxyribonuclease VII small subunit